jgi:hypothetical protein
MKSVSLFACMLLCSCAWGFGGRKPQGVSLYSVQPDGAAACPVKNGEFEEWCGGEEGLYRPSAKDHLTFTEGKNYIAVSPEDFNKIIKSCPSK